MTNKKPIIIGVLCSLVIMMATAFALLSGELTITGSSHIDSNWNIRITNIRVKNLVSAYATGANASTDVVLNEGCTTTTAPCNTTTATFEASLKTPGDYITYEVTITNTGTLDGVVESINLECSENSAITCTTSGLNKADKILKTNGTNTVDVTVTYNQETSTQPVNTNSTVTLTINYQQDLGQVISYPTYSVGDTITYKGSNWRVIKNSGAEEDYVTLMKETRLTGTEIGANYVYGGNTSNNYMVYYWSSTCHYGYTYGSDVYSSSDESGCSGHNDYAGSKIKEVVDNYMTTNNMTDDLKEIDGYRIRLITREELNTNLGWSALDKQATDADNSSVPTWVYSTTYWTMSPNANKAAQSWNVDSVGGLSSNIVINNGHHTGVRPVIHLLKSNIPAQS